MLKCNLKDLIVISDEEVRYNGFISQFDFYIWVLTCEKELEEANLYIRKLKKRTWLDKEFHKNPAEKIIFEIRNDFKETYRFFPVLCDTIINNYNEVKKEYPNFDEYIKSIADCPSADSFSFTPIYSPLFN